MAGQEDEIALRDFQANRYDDAFVRTRGHFGYCAQVRTVLSFLAPQREDAILDLGCGTGIYTIAAARRSRRVMAVDFSEQSIRQLQKKAHEAGLGNIEATVADLTEWSPPPAIFTKVIMIEVLQHIPGAKQRLRVVQEARSALLPGGMFLCVIYRYGGWIRAPKPKEEFNHGGLGLYRYAFTETDVKELFEQAGVKLASLNGLHILPRILRKRLPAALASIETFLSRLPFARNAGDYYIACGTRE